jgi:glycosyltransferase involved in cell wall biosynthesis
MILSILIPTVPQRARVYLELITELNKQIDMANAFGVVEIITDDAPVGAKTTGQKRNDLINSAQGDYVWFIDDDDMIMPNAINNILPALELNPDALAINGIMTTDGNNMKQWYISKDFEYRADFTKGFEIYIRPTNHITPIKREIAKQVKFKNQSNFEDYEYCMELNNLGLVKTEVEIKEAVYHYRYISTNKLY